MIGPTCVFRTNGKYERETYMSELGNELHQHFYFKIVSS